MTKQEIKDAVVGAHAALSSAIELARANGVAVNLWVTGTGPTRTGPSEVCIDFADGGPGDSPQTIIP